MEIRSELFSQREVDDIITEVEILCAKVEKISVRVLSNASDLESEFELKLYDLKSALRGRLDKIFDPLLSPLNDIRSNFKTRIIDELWALARVSSDICRLEALKQDYWMKIIGLIPELFPESYPEINKKYIKAV